MTFDPTPVSIGIYEPFKVTVEVSMFMTIEGQMWIPYNPVTEE